MRAAGFVLTGGMSARMGRDKALLPWQGTYLVDVIARTLRRVADHVSLIGQPQRYEKLSWPCLPDLRSNLGPLAGIETALTSNRANLNLIVGCDMPDLDLDMLQVLLQHAEASRSPCVAARDDCGLAHPLCAVYRQSCLSTVSRALDEGRLRLLSLLEELDAVYVDVPRLINNVNTPLEWRAFQHGLLQGE